MRHVHDGSHNGVAVQGLAEEKSHHEGNDDTDHDLTNSKSQSVANRQEKDLVVEEFDVVLEAIPGQRIDEIESREGKTMARVSGTKDRRVMPPSPGRRGRHPAFVRMSLR